MKKFIFYILLVIIAAGICWKFPLQNAADVLHAGFWIMVADLCLATTVHPATAFGAVLHVREGETDGTSFCDSPEMEAGCAADGAPGAMGPLLRFDAVAGSLPGIDTGGGVWYHSPCVTGNRGGYGSNALGEILTPGVKLVSEQGLVQLGLAEERAYRCQSRRWEFAQTRAHP